MCKKKSYIERYASDASAAVPIYLAAACALTRVRANLHIACILRAAELSMPVRRRTGTDGDERTDGGGRGRGRGVTGRS